MVSYVKAYCIGKIFQICHLLYVLGVFEEEMLTAFQLFLFLGKQKKIQD